MFNRELIVLAANFGKDTDIKAAYWEEKVRIVSGSDAGESVD